MGAISKLIADRRTHRLALLGGLVGCGVVLVGWRMGFRPSDVGRWWGMAEEFLKVRPWYLVGALVVLPFFPVPISALLILAGVVWRQQPVMACGISLGAMLLNMAASYWIAARPGRGLVEKFLVKWKVAVPAVPPGQDLKLVVLLRLTPGLPFFIQNYTLGFLRVPFRMFLPVSFVCVALPMAGMVLGGAGMASGSWMPIIGGIGLLVAGFVAVRFVRSALGNKAKGTGTGP